MKKFLILALITTVFSACSLISQKTDPDSAPKPEGDKQIISDESKELVDENIEEIFIPEPTVVYREEAIKSLDYTICDNIDVEEERQECINVVSVEFMRNASEKKDQTLCEKINEQSKQDECFSMFKAEDPELITE